jgi:hypothetical protein
MRIANAIIRQSYDGKKPVAPMLDIRYGNMEGIVPHIARLIDNKYFDEWVHHAAYVSSNIIPVVIRVPKVFQLFESSDLRKKLTETWVAMMTIAPTQIDGFKGTVTVETESHKIGGAGEEHEEFVKANRERTTITNTYTERLGKPYNRFLDFIIRYLIEDPDTGFALVNSLPLLDGGIKKGELYTPDYYTGTVLYFEPDRIHRNIVEAYLCTNIAPKSAGEITSKKEIGANKELKEYQIEFTSITQQNENVKVIAQQILDKMTIVNSTPDTAPVAIHDDDFKLANSTEFQFNEKPIENVGNFTAYNSKETFVSSTKETTSTSSTTK